MTAVSRIFSLRDHVRSSWRILLKEVAAFGAIGAISLVIDLGLFNLLLHHGALKAKCVSTIVATIVRLLRQPAPVVLAPRAHQHRPRDVVLLRHQPRRAGDLRVGPGAVRLPAEPAARPRRDERRQPGDDRRSARCSGSGRYKRFVFLHPDKVHAPDVDLEVELAE